MRWTIAGMTPDGKEIWRYEEPERWTRIATLRLDNHQPWVDKMWGGARGLIASVRPGGGVDGIGKWYTRGPGAPDWAPIGGPGANFVMYGSKPSNSSMYGLTPNRDAVWVWTRGGASWDQVGGPALDIFAGGYGVFATNPVAGDLFRLKQGEWSRIGSAGAEFAVTAESVYGLTPDRQAVWRYDGVGDSWTKVGGPAEHLYAGLWGLVALNPFDHQLWHYKSPDNWEAIGDNGAKFVVTDTTVFGLTPDKAGVYRYDGQPYQWTFVGGGASDICAYIEED